MNRRKIALWWSVLMIVCGVLGLVTLPSSAAPTSPAVAQAASIAAGPAVAQSTQSCLWEPDGKCYWYNGYHFQPFDNPLLCLQNNIGTYWDIPTAGAGFVSGNNTVRFYNRRLNVTPSCADDGFAPGQIITLTTYNNPDGHCSKVSGNNNNGIWTGLVVVWMNLAYPSQCTATAQARNNEISNAIGAVLGLSYFSSSTNLTAAVMNRYFASSYNWPGSDDRNALYWLY